MCKRWTNDLRIVMPVMKANGYEPARSCGSHTVFENKNGDTISIPKSINRMLWRREVRKHNIVGGMAIIGKFKGQLECNIFIRDFRKAGNKYGILYESSRV